MEFEVNIDEKFKEILVIINTSKLDEEVENLIKYIEATSNNFVGFRNDRATILNISEIIRICVEDRKLIAVTPKGKYIIKKKLYEVLEVLPNNFVKISQSEIANIRFIENLDLSFAGTIVIKYKNSDTSYVARRRIKEFKRLLNI